MKNFDYSVWLKNRAEKPATIISKKQIEAIEKLGGTIHDDYITFNVNNQEWGEHCEDEEKIWNKIQKILPGIDGALQGHPFDEGDLNYIYFRLDFLPDSCL